MKKFNLITVVLLLFVGILSVGGFFDIIGKSIESGGLQNFLTQFSVNNLVDTHNIECSIGNSCSKNTSVPVVIWLFCCCIVGLVGYKRRKIK